MPDRSQIVDDANLDANKDAFAAGFVQRPEFLQQYPASLDGPHFIDLLLQNVRQGSGVDLSSLRSVRTSDWDSNGSRGRIMRLVVDSPVLTQAEYNSSFVLMQYFGYLRRDPDQAGYNFWLNILNTRDQNNYRRMVCSFITSADYQHRFGPSVTHTNMECGQ